MSKRPIVNSIAAMLCVFCLLPVVGYNLLYYYLASGHPHDPSIGDAIGWFIVFTLPILVPFLIIASVIAGIVVWGRNKKAQSIMEELKTRPSYNDRIPLEMERAHASFETVMHKEETPQS